MYFMQFFQSKNFKAALGGLFGCDILADEFLRSLAARVAEGPEGFGVSNNSGYGQATLYTHFGKLKIDFEWNDCGVNSLQKAVWE